MELLIGPVFVGAGSGRLGGRGGLTITSYCCSIEMRTTGWGAFSQSVRISTVASRLRGPVR